MMEKLDMEIVEKELPAGWEWRRLGEVCKTTSGGTPDRKNASFYNGTIPWVKSGELDKGIIYETEEYITEAALENSSAKLFPKGTILIAMYGATIGKIAVLGVEACTNQAICGILQSPALEPIYLLLYLESQRSNLVKLGTGGAQPNINQGVIKNLPVPLPPLAEQQRIVAQIEALFSELEAGKARIFAAQHQLKTYRQAVLKWAFEGRLTREDVVEGELPEGWETTLIESIGDVQLGRQRSPGNVSNLFPRKYIRAANITENGLDLSNLLEMEFSPKEFPRFKLEYGDLVLSEASGSASQVGKPAIWNNEIEDCCFQNTVIRLRLHDIRSVDYLLWLLKFFYKSGFFAKVAGGVGINHLSAGKFSKIEIPLPPLEEQHRIVQEIESRLSQCDALEAGLQAALQQAESLRQSILKQAFEGKLVG